MKRDDLIFDVGMYLGEDAEHYLSRGFNVVGVEANPEVVARIEERFAREIKTGRLTIVSAAVAVEPGKVEFAVSDDEPGWSTLDPHFMSRNKKVGTRYRTVEVPAVRFADLLAEYGVPHYLKVDIEGSDMLCVRALHGIGERPNYVSLETVVTSPGTGLVPMLDELVELWTLGYRGFKFIDQAPLWEATKASASGPFGDETPGEWTSIWPTLAHAAAIRAEFELGGFGGRWTDTSAGRAFQQFRTEVLNRPMTPWYDLHAKLGDASDPRATVEADHLRARLEGTERALTNLREELRQREEELFYQHEALQGIQTSASWRLTAPLRGAKRNMKRIWRRRAART